MVEAAEHRSRPDGPGRGTDRRLGRLQRQRPMGPLTVIGGDELGEPRSQLLLAGHDDVSRALEAQGAGRTFRDGARTG